MGTRVLGQAFVDSGSTFEEPVLAFVDLGWATDDFGTGIESPMPKRQCVVVF